MLSSITAQSLALTLAAIIVVDILFVLYTRRPAHSLPYPPGPKGEFFFGNARQMPAKAQWTTFAKWGEQYGEAALRLHRGKLADRPRCAHSGGIVFMRIFRAPFLIINSAIAASDLLDKRSTIYSDRPMSIMANEL